MKKLFLLISFITSINSYAQNSWKEGYIVKNLTDTIHGLIEVKNSKSRSEECNFKKDDASKEETFTPNDITCYRFTTGELFVSKNIIENDSFKPVFLEFIVDGTISFYHYKNNYDNYYFAEKNDKLYKLKMSESRKQNSDPYLGMLIFLMQEIDMRKEIEATLLEPNSLIALAKAYHKKICADGECIVYQKKIKPIKLKYGLLIGSTLHHFQFKKYTYSDTTYNAQLGIKFELENLFKWNENLNIESSLVLQRYSKYILREYIHLEPYNYDSEIIYNDIEYLLVDKYDNNIFGTKELEVDLKTYVLKIPILLKYTLFTGKFKPYISGGIYNSLIIFQNKEFKYMRNYSYYNHSIPNYQIGLIGSVGAKYKLQNEDNISIELNYEYSNYLDFRNRTFALNLGYMF